MNIFISLLFLTKYKSYFKKGTLCFQRHLSKEHFFNDGQTLTGQADQLLPKFILVGLPVGISEDIIKRLAPGLISANPLRQVKIVSVIVGIIAILISLVIGCKQVYLVNIT